MFTGRFRYRPLFKKGIIFQKDVLLNIYKCIYIYICSYELSTLRVYLKHVNKSDTTTPVNFQHTFSVANSQVGNSCSQKTKSSEINKVQKPRTWWRMMTAFSKLATYFLVVLEQSIFILFLLWYFLDRTMECCSVFDVFNSLSIMRT